MDVEIFHPADIRGTLENRKICTYNKRKGYFSGRIIAFVVSTKRDKMMQIDRKSTRLNSSH